MRRLAVPVPLPGDPRIGCDIGCAARPEPAARHAEQAWPVGLVAAGFQIEVAMVPGIGGQAERIADQPAGKQRLRGRCRRQGR